MTNINDDKYQAVNTVNLALGDEYFTWLGAQPGVSASSNTDREFQFLTTKGYGPGPLGDMWFEFLSSLGYTGTVQDMKKIWWLEGAGVAFYTLTVAHDGSTFRYGFSVVASTPYGDLAPRDLAGFNVAQVSGDGSNGVIQLHMEGVASPFYGVRLTIAGDSQDLFWQTAAYLGTNQAISDAIIAAEGGDLDIRLDVIPAP